jgi:hypothetical protein
LPLETVSPKGIDPRPQDAGLGSQSSPASVAVDAVRRYRPGNVAGNKHRTAVAAARIKPPAGDRSEAAIDAAYKARYSHSRNHRAA